MVSKSERSPIVNPPTAVLASGGMDSCILLANTAKQGIAHPIYVETGIPWEWAEKQMLQNFIDAVDNPNIRPVTTLQLPVQPLYGTSHWTMSGETVPGYEEPDETVYIPGRNIILITLAAIWCSLNDVHRIVIGSLAGNPFPDATPDFFQSIANSNATGLDHPLTVEAPMRHLHKEDILAANAKTLPLHLTLTCANPQLDDDKTTIIHCAACNKCRERHEAFIEAGIPDNTLYTTDDRVSPARGGNVRRTKGVTDKDAAKSPLPQSSLLPLSKGEIKRGFPGEGDRGGQRGRVR